MSTISKMISTEQDFGKKSQ